MNRKTLTACILASLTSGCVTLSKDVNLTSGASDKSTLLIYRERAFFAALVSLYIGKDDKYFMKLRNNQYDEIEINSGEHLLQAKADASPASLLTVILEPNAKICLSAKPNPDLAAAMIVPLVANMIPTFLLEEVECPGDQKLSEYERVSASGSIASKPSVASPNQ